MILIELFSAECVHIYRALGVISVDIYTGAMRGLMSESDSVNQSNIKQHTNEYIHNLFEIGPHHVSSSCLPDNHHDYLIIAVVE